MNAKTQTRVEALKMALRNDEAKKDIVVKFCAEWKVSTPTVLRLITIAQQEIKNELKEKKEIINKVRRKKIEEAAEDDIITELEADVILCNILRGKMKVKKAFNTVNGLVIEEVGPDHNTILKALDMYYKRMGSYKINKEEEKKEEEEEEITDFMIGCNVCPNEEECSEGCKKWAGITDKEIKNRRWSELMPDKGQQENEITTPTDLKLSTKTEPSVHNRVYEETRPIEAGPLEQLEGGEIETNPQAGHNQEELINKTQMQTIPIRDKDGHIHWSGGMFSAPKRRTGVKNYPVR